MKKRAVIFWTEHRDLVKLIMGLALFGSIYTVFTTLTGIGIPCIIYQVTGLCCPGCGVSRLFLCLLRFQFFQAPSQNLAIALLLPLWLFIGCIEFWWNPKVLQQGSRLNRFLLVGTLVLLLAFGVVRNLPGFEFLLPGA